MKILISTLFLPIVIFLKFGELNAMEGRGSSSGIGFERPGLRHRGPGGQAVVQPVNLRAEPLISELKTNFMTHDVRLRISGGKVVQASMLKNIIPDSPGYQKKHFYIIRLAKIAGYDTVIYVNMNESLMGIRPPNLHSENIMEPDDTTWFITYDDAWFKVRVNPDPNRRVQEKPAVGIELLSGNSIKPTDILGKVTFPWIKFYVYREKPRGKIMGATLPPQ